MGNKNNNHKKLTNSYGFERTYYKPSRNNARNFRELKKIQSRITRRILKREVSKNEQS